MSGRLLPRTSLSHPDRCMSAIDDLFLKLRNDGQKAFMPFITAGDPDLEFTASIIKELDKRGCHLCEVGIPYSDPDGARS